MKALHFTIHGTAYDTLPSGARNRAVGLAAALLRAGHAVAWMLPAGSGSVVATVRDEFGVPAFPVERFREIATSLDPLRPVARLLTAGRALSRVVPKETDLFVTDYYPVLADLPTAVTIHDLRYLVAPQSSDVARTLWFRNVYPAALRRAALVLVPTVSVAVECAAHLGVTKDRVAVVPNALGRPWRTAEPAGATPLHLLLLGASDPRKDVETAFQAMRRAAGALRGGASALLPLVVASRRSKSLNQSLAGAEDLVRRGLVKFLDAPDDGTLVSLARDAAALVHPSRYEGFGMPVIEAMSVGLPVLAADCAAVREVGGGLVHLLPVGDVDQFAAAIRAQSAVAPRDDHRAPDRIARGRSFTWDRAAAAIVAATRNL